MIRDDVPITFTSKIALVNRHSFQVNIDLNMSRGEFYSDFFSTVRMRDRIGRRSPGSRLSGKKPEFTYFFALRDKVSHLPDLSKAELEEIIKYKELLVRQLLLEINERNLSTLSGLLTSKIEDGTFNANKAYAAAFIARYVVNMAAARDAAQGAAWGAAVGVLGTTLPILKEVDPTKLGQKAYVLSELISSKLAHRK